MFDLPDSSDLLGFILFYIKSNYIYINDFVLYLLKITLFCNNIKDAIFFNITILLIFEELDFRTVLGLFEVYIFNVLEFIHIIHICIFIMVIAETLHDISFVSNL